MDSGRQKFAAIIENFRNVSRERKLYTSTKQETKMEQGLEPLSARTRDPYLPIKPSEVFISRKPINKNCHKNGDRIPENKQDYSEGKYYKHLR